MTNPRTAYEKLMTYISLTCVAVFLVACQTDPSVSPKPPIENPEPGSEPMPRPFVPSTDTDPCLRLALQIPNQAPEGKGLTGELRVTNSCSEAVEKWLAPVIMYVLEDELIIWDSTDDLPPPGSLDIVQFAPNETRVYELGWDGTGTGDKAIPGGSYEIVARLGVDGPESKRFLNLDSDIKSLSIE